MKTAAPSELGAATTLAASDWRDIYRSTRRRVVRWCALRILMLPLLALGAAVGAIKAWEGVKVIGFGLAPFFALAALGIHIYDIARSVRGRIDVLTGEVLGRFPDDYDEATLGFDVGRKREFLVDGAALATLDAAGRRRHLSAHPRPRRLRATRRMIGHLRNGDDAVLLVVNDRIFDRLG